MWKKSMRTNFIVKNTKIFFKFISRLFRNNSYYTFCKFIKCRKYVFPIERVKNDSTFLIPLWIRRVEIAYYFTLFKNKDATRFPLIAEELSLQTRRRINIVENNNLSIFFFRWIKIVPRIASYPSKIVSNTDDYRKTIRLATLRIEFFS